jgi:hypothetical protein
LGSLTDTSSSHLIRPFRTTFKPVTRSRELTNENAKVDSSPARLGRRHRGGLVGLEPPCAPTDYERYARGINALVVYSFRLRGPWVSCSRACSSSCRSVRGWRGRFCLLPRGSS